MFTKLNGLVIVLTLMATLGQTFGLIKPPLPIICGRVQKLVEDSVSKEGSSNVLFDFNFFFFLFVKLSLETRQKTD